MNEATKVLIADDHAIMREGVRSLLERVDRISVVGDTGSASEVIGLVKRCRPDIVLLDISMPGINGLELTGQISQKFPVVGVIILSMHADQEYVLRALRAGAKGYVLKESAFEELVQAFRAVVDGQTFLSPTVSTKVVASLVHRTQDVEAAPNRLTQRQRQVLRLLAEGKPTREVAALLNVSVKTVETHRAQIMERLQIFDIAGLVRFAVRHGLVDVE